MNKQDKTPRKIRTVKTMLLINSLALLAVLITSFLVENTTVSTLLKVFTILHSPLMKQSIKANIRMGIKRMYLNDWWERHCLEPVENLTHTRIIRHWNTRHSKYKIELEYYKNQGVYDYDNKEIILIIRFTFGGVHTFSNCLVYGSGICRYTE